MKLSKTVFLMFALFAFSQIQAQKLDVKKVSVAELEEQACPGDPSAAASILYNIGEVSLDYSQNAGFTVKTKVKTRIKIYKKEGYSWANKNIEYYVGSADSKEKISISDAVTYNLVDGKIIKTKLKSDGEFDESINQYWNRKKITMPNVKEGSVIEYEYTIQSPNIGEISRWDFQYGIPVKYSEFTTRIPEYLVYNVTGKGHIAPQKIVDKYQKNITITNKERYQGGGFSAVETTFTENKINYEETQTVYIAKDLPAMKNEAFVNNIENYLASIDHELAMTKYPNSQHKLLSTDWETIVGNIYNNERFGGELNKSKYFEADLNATLKNLTAKNEIIAAVFNLVKSKVKWNEYNGYHCSQGVKQAYESGTGNVAEINLILTAMLRHAGINANPVLLSTRANGVPLYPNRNGFNYVISAVEVENDLILLDATEPFSVPNILPLRDLNWVGRLIRKDGSSANVDLMPRMISKEMASLNVLLDKNGAIEGKLKRQVSNHEGMYMRKANLKTDKDTYLTELENQYGNIEIEDYERENDNKLSEPVVEYFSFKGKNLVDVINDKIYISPLLFLADRENPFKMDKREYPVDFGYPSERKYNVSIEIPEGYVVESLPQAINLAFADGLGSFKYLISASGNKIQLMMVDNINTSVVLPEFYESLKGFSQRSFEKQNEKIVLKKA